MKLLFCKSVFKILKTNTRCYINEFLIEGKVFNDTFYSYLKLVK